MASGRFEEIPATTTLEDLAKHNRNWDKTDVELTTQQNDYNGKITAEQQARVSSDSNLQAQITKEVQDRMTAVTAHISAIAAHAAAAITLNPVTGLTANNLQTAVEQLRTMLTTIIAGPAPSAAEIQAARVGADNVARASLDILIKEIHAKLIAANNQITPLTRGQNLITASEAGPVAVSIKGNTLVNLLGNIGNFEVDSNGDGVADGLGKGLNGAIATLETNNAKYGLKAQRITSTVNDTQNWRYVDKYGFSFEAGKYYLVLVDVVTDGTSRGQLEIGYGYTAVGTRSSISDTTLYTKYTPSTSLAGTGFVRVLNTNAVGVAGWVQFDGFRLYEVDAATYAKIDVDPEYTGAKLAARYPYVDGVKHTVNPVITKIGKNPLPPFTEWSKDNYTTIAYDEPYKVTYIAFQTYYRFIYYTVPVISGKTYVFTLEEKTAAGRILVSKGTSRDNTVVGWTALNSLSFTADETYGGYATICFDNGNTTSGTFTFSKPMLSMDASSPFEPRNDDYLNALTTLAGYGSVNDVLTVRGVEAMVMRRWKTDVQIPGTLLWIFSSDEAGYKTIYTDNFGSDGLSNGLCVGSRPDGNPIGTMYPSGTTNRAMVSFNGGTSKLYMNIPDVLSGWGEDYTPLAAEMKAYFWGWKMNNGTFGQPYNGTGTKTWTRWDATGSAGAVTVVPTTMAEGYTPYKLSYQLATPVTEVVPIEGSLANHTGANLYEVSEGVIVREKVKPALGASSPVYYINFINFPDSLCKYRVKNFIRVFRNGVVDTKWTEFLSADVSYGLARLHVPAANYDPSAEYTVTYLALDKYALTAPVVEGALEYNTSSKMVQDTLVQRTTDAETAITIHDRILAQHTARLLALEA